MDEPFSGARGHALASLEWLLLHHSAKFHARRRIAESLCVSAGMSVVDIGCGPGLWSSLLAEQVAPHGSVLGLDIDPQLIQHAKEHVKIEGPVRTSFEVADFCDLSRYTGQFDVAFSANCFAYYPEATVLVREFSKCVHQRGILVGRHFDNTFWISSGIDPSLTAFVLEAASRSGRRDPIGRYFDNAFGQRMHQVFREAGLRHVRTESVSVDLCAPLSRAARDYLSLTAEWTAKVARFATTSSRIDAWLSHFDPSSRDYILDGDDCLFTFIEYTTCGSRG